MINVFGKPVSPPGLTEEAKRDIADRADRFVVSPSIFERISTDVDFKHRVMGLLPAGPSLVIERNRFLAEHQVMVFGDGEIIAMLVLEVGDVGVPVD